MRYENIFLGFQFPSIVSMWILGDFGKKTHKIREDLTRLGTIPNQHNLNLGRGFKSI